MQARNVLDRLDWGVIEGDGAHFFEAGVVAGHAEDPEEAVETVSGIGPHKSVGKIIKINFGWIQIMEIQNWTFPNGFLDRLTYTTKS